jgi:predicted negative regulator of RcsB-dependent stress response
MTERSDKNAARGVGVDERTESIFEWLHVNSRLVGIAGAVVAVVAIGGWLYTRNQAGKELRAQQTLQRAEQSLVQGNTPLAQTDLQKLISTQGGTAGASQGAMLLAQTYYDKGEYQKGLDALEKSGAARKEFEAPAEALIGDGYSQLGKYAEAATHYKKAAEVTRFKSDREGYLADAARNYAAAKDTAQARQTWEEVLKDEDGVFAAEARVRLGELTARPISKS